MARPSKFKEQIVLQGVELLRHERLLFIICINNIRRIRKFLMMESTKVLVHAFIMGRTDCHNSLLYSLPAARLICAIPCFNHVSSRHPSVSGDNGCALSCQISLVESSVWNGSADLSWRDSPCHK